MKAPPTNGVTGGGRVQPLRPEDSRELYDLGLERDFLCSAMHYPEILLASEVVEGDFYAGANARTFAAMLSLVADGEPIGMVGLQSRLHERGQLAGVGGVDYLLQLDAALPTPIGPWPRIRKLAARRKVRDLALLVASKAADDQEFDRYYDQLLAARAALSALDSPRSRLPTLDECVPMIAEFGPRLSFALPMLDEATRGGVPAGRVIMLLGAPGSSKTNYSTFLADSWERAGCAVLILACDESRESIVTRIGQLDGHARELLEGRDDGRRNAFARNARGRFIWAIDPFKDRVTLEEAYKQLRAVAGERQAVLVVDSLQTVPCDAADLLETKREQVEAVVLTLDGYARDGAIVLAISEMSRAGYRTGARDKDISALSAGAESRKVEFAAHLLLGLRPVKGEQGIVDVEIAKNRLGPGKPDLRMSLDFETLRFRQIVKPDEDEEAAERENARDSHFRKRILEVLRANTELRHAADVVRLAKAGKRPGLAALRELVTEKMVGKVDGFYRVLSPVREQD